MSNFAEVDLQELDFVAGGFSEYVVNTLGSSWAYSLPGISMGGYTNTDGSSGSHVTAGGHTISHTSSYSHT